MTEQSLKNKKIIKTIAIKPLALLTFEDCKISYSLFISHRSYGIDP